MEPTEQVAIAATRRWLERAVIGLNLCPFARAPHVADRIHYTVSDAVSTEGLLEHVFQALLDLSGANPEERETTLLIVPDMLQSFIEFNEFLPLADAAIEALQLEGVIQIASFHPAYQFTGTEPDAIENYTNRSPFPMLHLLRESSIDRAVEAMQRTDDIYEANISTLNKLGKSGWNALWKDVKVRPSQTSPTGNPEHHTAEARRDTDQTSPSGP